MRQEKVLLLSSVFILFLGLQIQMQQMFVLLYLFGLLYEQSLVTHIRIEAPKDSAVDISSWYQQHDFVVQAVVDGRTIFIDWPPNELKNWRSSTFGALSHANINCSFTVDWQLFDISNGF